MKKIAWSGFIVALMLVVGLPVYAQQHSGHGAHRPAQGMHRQMHGAMAGGHGMGGGMHGTGMPGKAMFSMAQLLIRNADELKLSDEQVGKLYRIKSKHAKSRGALMMTMHQEMGELHGVILDPAATEANLRAAAKKHTDGFTKIIDNAWQERTEALAVLTAQQKTALKGLKSDTDSDEQEESD